MSLRTKLGNPTFQISGFAPYSSSSSFDKSHFLTHSYIFSNCFKNFTISLNYKRFYNKLPIISCKNIHSNGNFHSNPHNYHQSDDEYIEASLLISETLRHHNLRKRGFRGEGKEFSGHFIPSSNRVKDMRNNVNSIGLSILRRFRHPTIFLKISCEGDFLLPIVVGEFAVEKLIDSLNEDDDYDRNYSEFQFVRNLVVGLGNEVRMVKITKRVVDTYFARIYFGKVEKRENFSVDARPSDAINVAQRCKAPIYVNKEIFLSDAIKIAYGTGRVRDTKPIYDVLLDSPMDGSDKLVQEFTLVQNMKLAVEEERYYDAAMWRDKLTKLLSSGTQASQPKTWNEASTPGLL